MIGLIIVFKHYNSFKLVCEPILVYPCAWFVCPVLKAVLCFLIGRCESTPLKTDLLSKEDVDMVDRLFLAMIKVITIIFMLSQHGWSMNVFLDG